MRTVADIDRLGVEAAELAHRQYQTVDDRAVYTAWVSLILFGSAIEIERRRRPLTPRPPER